MICSDCKAAVSADAMDRCACCRWDICPACVDKPCDEGGTHVSEEECGPRDDDMPSWSPAFTHQAGMPNGRP